ncbi:peptidoglycan-binding protein [Dactylosporangium siamense]|uniref:Peptidoglycan binding-like domain-containing protein n=1 Tax=Dactylosporangium siamense TaxID=685454 RepID=A0A919PLK4_9ACTN|nr:peptidoglycan-binding protein [Dactylosporangium siamense]GIG47040.1 hypothetical protein Dsi01nite_050810 [Dactylosporangium siamense]
MRLLRTVLATVALFGLFGVVFGADDGDADEDQVAVELDGLRGCGAMRSGDGRRDCVRHLQRVLQVRGAPLEPSGNYLDDTTRYVTEFQTGQGLRADGAVDRRTLDALTDLPGDGRGWDLRRDCVSLRGPAGTAPGSAGGCVVTLRDRLAGRGVPAGRGADFDDAATAAVRTFQQRAGLPVVGVAGPQTRLALSLPQPASGAVASGCTPRGCLIVIGRAYTRDAAAVIPEDPFLRGVLADVISGIACAQVRAVPAVAVGCQAVGSYIVDTLAEALKTAATRGACVQVKVGYPAGRDTWSPLSIAPYNGANCRD